MHLSCRPNHRKWFCHPIVKPNHEGRWGLPSGGTRPVKTTQPPGYPSTALLRWWGLSSLYQRARVFNAIGVSQLAQLVLPVGDCSGQNKIGRLVML